MNYSIAIFLMSDKVRGILATYEDHEGAEKKFFKTLDPDIKPDDYVVVETDTRHHMTVCKVTDVDVEVDIDTDANIKWIIGVVRRADFDALKAHEDQAITAVKKAEKRKRRNDMAQALKEDLEAAGEDMPTFAIADQREPAPATETE